MCTREQHLELRKDYLDEDEQKLIEEIEKRRGLFGY